MSICAIIFDLDGVLIDSEHAHRQSWIQLGRELGLEIADQAIKAVFGRQNRDIVPILYGDERSPEEVRALGRRKEQIYRELVRGRLAIKEGAIELVHHYRVNGYPLAIGSSTPRANIDLALTELGLTGVFEVLVAGEDVAVGKPDPSVFLLAATRLGVAPGQCMVIEDAPSGIQAARAAGMPVVALVGSYPLEALNRANRIIHRLGELIPQDALQS